MSSVVDLPKARCIAAERERYGSRMTSDDPNARLRTTPIGPGVFANGPVIPPPPTGPLTPPAPPPLSNQGSDAPAGGESARQGAHRDEVVEPGADMPPYLGSGGQLPEGLRIELIELLGRTGGRLHEVFDQYRAGVTSPAALAAAGAGANEALAGEIVLRVRTILGEAWTGSPGRARPVAGAVRALMRAPGLSRGARQYLTELRAGMLDLAESEAAQQQEQSQLDANSAMLDGELRSGNGLFVYTYPHYWRYPYFVEQNRRLLRLGKAAHGVWQGIVEQARASGAPEDPILLRVYLSGDPAAAESAFRRLLESADHADPVTNNGGREWFATTLEFLDEIAVALGVEIKAGPNPAL